MAEGKLSDFVWARLKQEAEATLREEPLLKIYLEHAILECGSLGEGFARIIAASLASKVISRDTLYQLCMEAFTSDPDIVECIASDLDAVVKRDPAAGRYLDPFLYLKGPHALEAWRVSHWLWQQGRKALAHFLQSLISDIYALDINPAAKIGRGIMLDHATGIVIGETAVVGDNVSILQDVTLGGTGKEQGDRHPKVGSGVMIGAGAKVLGNIRIGDGAKVGACSVVLKDVAPHTTVAGIPARVVGRPKDAVPAFGMDQELDTNTDVCTSACGVICHKML